MNSLEGDLGRYSRQEYGDFIVMADHWEQAAEHQSERSEAAREADQARRAPVTTHPAIWASNPNRYDFPGVDTPTAAPKVLPKDYTTDAYRRSTTNVRTTDSPEHGTKPPRSPLGGAEIAAEHDRGRASRFGLSPMDLEHHAGFYDERERHWERGHEEVETQSEVPEAFRGKEGRDRPHEVGASSARGILEARKRDDGSQFGVRR